MIESRIVLRVYGRTWAGYKACYQYSPDKAPQTDAEAKQIAGDFESLIDWHVVDKLKTLRGWRNGFSDRRYNRAFNA